MIIPAYFHEAGVPKTGLSPTLDIYKVSDNSLVVNDGAMTEIGGGFYKYSFVGYSTSEDYVYVVDGTATLANGYRYLAGGTNVDGKVGTLVEYLESITANLGKIPMSDGIVSWNATALAAIQSECADALNAYDPPTKAELDTGLDALPTAAEIKTEIEGAGGHLTLILEDTGTTLPTAIADVPTVAEFEARTIVAANYLVESDTLARVTLVDTCTVNTDMRGTDSAALAAVCTEGRLAELDAANLPADIADLPTNAELAVALAAADDAVLAAIAALNNLSSAGAQAAAAAALTAYGAALQTSVDDLETRLTAARAGYLDNLSGGAVATAAAVAALPTTAQINAEVVDALNVDTYAEPGQGTPAAILSLAQKIGYLFKSWRNEKRQSGSSWDLYNDAGAVVDQKATVSEAGAVVTKGKIGTGP